MCPLISPISRMRLRGLYSGQWNAFCPLFAVDFEFFSLSDIVNASTQGSI
jgi:hypothetical protein